MSNAQANDTPNDVDPEERIREGQEAENARMREETRTWGGKTVGSVPWADDEDQPNPGEARSKKRAAPAPASAPAEPPSAPPNA